MRVPRVALGHDEQQLARCLGALCSRAVWHDLTWQPQLQQPPLDEQPRPRRLDVRLQPRARFDARSVFGAFTVTY